MSDRYKAVRIVEENGSFARSVEELPLEALKDGDVLVRVEWSSLNYKDALSAHGNKGITREFPHTTGIDAAGRVVESSDERWKPGDEVVVTGFDLGMNTPGGHAEYIRVPGDWIVARPDGLSLRECMIIGTAGFTAAQCLYRTRQFELSPDKGDILVTGATGGVGSMAVALFSQAGYRVVAATRNPDRAQWLKEVGAADIISVDEVLDDSPKPLRKGRWAGAVDTVAGKTLESILKTTEHRGVITICGMITGSDLNTSVFPFILRGVSLVGIDSAECPLGMKRDIWELLSTVWHPGPHLETLATEISLQDVPEHLEAMMAGKTRGRTLVNL